MRSTKGTMLLLAALLVGLAGCQKLNYSKTFTLGPGNMEDLHFDPPAYNQRVTVTIAPTNGAVSAYLVKESDFDKVSASLKRNAEPAASLVLGSRVSRGVAEEYSFEASVPAKTEYALVIKCDMKQTDVKVTVVGR